MTFDFAPTYVPSIDAVSQARAKRRAALGCEELTPELQQALVPLLDFINDNMVINEGYMGLERAHRKDIPDYLTERLALIFHKQSKLITVSWMWEHMGTTYIVDEYAAGVPGGSTDVVVRVTTDDWMISFSTSKFLGYWRDSEPKVTAYTGWVDHLPHYKRRRVNDVIDFKIHNGEDAFYRDLIMLKLST